MSTTCPHCNGTRRTFWPDTLDGGLWADCPVCVEGRTLAQGGGGLVATVDERPRADKSLDDYRAQLRAKRRRVRR